MPFAESPLRTAGSTSLNLYAASAFAIGVRSCSRPAWPNCGVSYMPIMTTSNDLPPEPTSRVVISRSLPSSRIVYLTLIPLFAVNSDGVSEAMSVICGFFDDRDADRLGLAAAEGRTGERRRRGDELLLRQRAPGTSSAGAWSRPVSYP